MPLHTMNGLETVIAACTEDKRPGIEHLVAEAVFRIRHDPASTKYHGAYEGGWLDHTLEVARVCNELWATMTRVRTEFKADLFNSLNFVALAHDFGKLGEPGEKGKSLYLDQTDSKKADKEPYIYNTGILDYNHELRSIHWLNYYHIPYTEEEMIAVLHHAGPYDPAHKHIGNDSKHPLTILLHSADNLVGKVMGI